MKNDTLDWYKKANADDKKLFKAIFLKILKDKKDAMHKSDNNISKEKAVTRRQVNC